MEPNYQLDSVESGGRAFLSQVDEHKAISGGPEAPGSRRSCHVSRDNFCLCPVWHKQNQPLNTDVWIQTLIFRVLGWKKNPEIQVKIQGLDIEMVAKYKYLGVHLNNKQDWTDNRDAL